MTRLSELYRLDVDLAAMRRDLLDAIKRATAELLEDLARDAREEDEATNQR